MSGQNIFNFCLKCLTVKKETAYKISSNFISRSNLIAVFSCDFVPSHDHWKQINFTFAVGYKSSEGKGQTQVD